MKGDFAIFCKSGRQYANEIKSAVGGGFLKIYGDDGERLGLITDLQLLGRGFKGEFCNFLQKLTLICKSDCIGGGFLRTGGDGGCLEYQKLCRVHAHLSSVLLVGRLVGR